MRLEGAVVEIEDGILHIRIPFLRILEKKDIKIDSLPVRHTRREMEVLKAVLDLKANKEIAHELNLAERTVKFHVSSLLLKHKVRSRFELVDRFRNRQQEIANGTGNK